MTRFALIGAAGYVAPRHMRAIAGMGGELALTLDPHCSVGILDELAPGARFFRTFEQFDAAMHAARHLGQPITYLTVCTPNDLHEAHVAYGLRSGAHAICEKPLVLDPDALERLAALANATGKSVSTIMQLRLHPSVIALKAVLDAAPRTTIHRVTVTYVTLRGPWYHQSWKGEAERSGGITTNIGAHIFDLLGHLFGHVLESTVHHRVFDRAAGFLRYERAEVRWLLSINGLDVPEPLRPTQRSYREIVIGDHTLEFSAGFADLHRQSYEAIVAGQGFGIAEVRPSIALMADIRSAPIMPDAERCHPDLPAILRGPAVLHGTSDDARGG